MQMTYGDLRFKFRRIPRPLQPDGDGYDGGDGDGYDGGDGDGDDGGDGDGDNGGGGVGNWCQC